MKSLNSDQLRAQLSENNLAMNTLAEDNEQIVWLLKCRGLRAVSTQGSEIITAKFDEDDLTDFFKSPKNTANIELVRSKPAPLTVDELKAIKVGSVEVCRDS